MKSFVKRLAKPLTNWLVNSRFKKSYQEFLANPRRLEGQEAQALLRRAFVATKGKSIDWAYQEQLRRTPSKPTAVRSPLFPQCDETLLNTATEALRKDGIFVWPFRLSAEWLASVHQQMGVLPVTSLASKTDRQQPASIQPTAATYWHDNDELLAIPELRQISIDPAIVEVISRYLGCTPVFDFLTAWWSFPTKGGGPDSASAQLYHFDMDRVRWVKVFCYLTDVGVHNGPHAYVCGSHRNIGSVVKHDGRYSDAEVFAHYDRDQELLLTGPAGTLFIEDTMGFHKGVPVAEGKRAVFEYEYSINHFGYPHPEPTQPL